jgi:hypothetical protein
MTEERRSPAVAPVEPPAAAAPLPPESVGQHDPGGVHVYTDSGIREGNHDVPRWLVAVILSLLAFFVGYIVLHHDAQPTSARMR